jgi:nitrite reductase (NAD(P)H)
VRKNSSSSLKEILTSSTIHFYTGSLTEYFEHRNVRVRMSKNLIVSLTISQVENLYLNPPSWYAEQQPDRFRYHLGETVTSISPSQHIVHTAKGQSFKYDKCVLATGAGAGLPPYVSTQVAANTQGVFVYRNIADLDGIISYAGKDEVTRAVVVGGGLLGLEAAKAVYDLPSCVMFSK